MDRTTKPIRHPVCPSEQVTAPTVWFYNYLKFFVFQRICQLVIIGENICRSKSESLLQTWAAKCLRITEWLLHSSSLHRSVGDVITLIRCSNDIRIVNIGTVQGYRNCMQGNFVYESRSGNDASWLCQANSRLLQKNTANFVFHNFVSHIGPNCCYVLWSSQCVSSSRDRCVWETEDSKHSRVNAIKSTCTVIVWYVLIQSSMFCDN